MNDVDAGDSGEDGRRRERGRGRSLAAFILCLSLSVAGIVATAQDGEVGSTTHSTPADGRTGTVGRAQFTTSVVDREPSDRLSIASSGMEALYFFSELRDMEGSTITHRWQHFGTTVAEVSFAIGGPRWRVNSYKTLDPGLIGELTVELIDETETSLGKYSIAVFEPEDGAPSRRPAGSTALPRPGPVTPPDEKKTASPASITLPGPERANAPDEEKPESPASIALPRPERANAPDSADKSKSTSSALQAIFDVFPSGEYTLVNDSMSLDACPPSGRFDWRRGDDGLWSFTLSADRKLTLREASGDSSPLQPLAGNDRGADDCVLYSGHHFSPDTSELVIDRQLDCEGGSRDVFSMESLQRESDTVDLTLFDTEVLLCRYRL